MLFAKCDKGALTHEMGACVCDCQGIWQKACIAEVS